MAGLASVLPRYNDITAQDGASEGGGSTSMIFRAPFRFCSISPSMASASLSSNPISLSKIRISALCIGSSNLLNSPPPQSVSPSPASRTRKFSSSKKKSFAVTAGDFFTGMASRLFKPRKLIKRESQIEMNRKSQRRVAGESRFGTALEDACHEGIVWEQREKDVIAEKERRTLAGPGFSFSAAGLLIPYHLGVAHFLIENGYITENTPLAGASAGSIVCAAIASGLSMRDALKATKLLAQDCRLKGTAFRIGVVLREFLDKFLPDDIHVKCSGRVRVAVTQILWRPRGLLVDQFDSKEDLIDAIFASSFIPGYLAPRPATMFRNKLCVDGGLTLFMPPTSSSETVKVCAFPASRLGLRGIGISPDCNPKSRGTPREFFSWALEPASDPVLDKQFELGYLDASVWAGQHPLEKVARKDVHSCGRSMDPVVTPDEHSFGDPDIIPLPPMKDVSCSKMHAKNDATVKCEVTLSTPAC